LFLTGALRKDDNSAFGANFNGALYPKVSGSWVISEEPFWHIGFIDALRLRAAYGQTGQQPSAFAAVRTYGSLPGETGSPGLATGESGNADLGPERGVEWETGLEASLFKGRIALEFNYYNSRTKDAIVGVPTVPSEGFIGTKFVNAGTITNRGIEAMLRARVLDGRNLSWDLTANISKNNNKVEELAQGLEQINVLVDLVQHHVGYPAFSLFTRRVVSADIGADGIARNVLCDGGPENNNQPMPCSSAPRLFAGPGLPKVEGAVSSTLTLFKRLQLYALVDFKTGHVLWNQDYRDRCLGNTCREKVFPLEVPATLAAAVQDPGTSALDWAVSDAGFAKLREVSASYILPTKWARVLGAARGSISVAGRNLHTWTNWTGLDPESYQAGSDPARFFRPYNTTPQLAQFVATISLSF
jgi:hypothetical protein